MEIIGDQIIFNSGPDFYQKEERGIKPNTVRVLNNQESHQLAEVYFSLKTIRIQNTENGAFFERVLTDISLFADRFIFSWRPEL